MTAAALLAAYTVAILYTGRELSRAAPREGRLMAAVAAMIVLAVLAGGAITGGVM